MSRINKPVVTFPPSVGTALVDNWNRQVATAINNLPFSIFSTANGPNVSKITAPEGFIGFEVGSSNTKLWVKYSGSTSTGWKEIQIQ